LKKIEQNVLTARPGYQHFKAQSGYVYSYPRDPFAAIALTRAIGDNEFYLLQTPNCTTKRIRPEDLTLLIASDGLVEFSDNPNNVIRHHVRNARKAFTVVKSQDNLSIISLYIL